MSILDLNLQDVPDLKAVDEDEYELRCEDADVRKSDKTGGKYIILYLEIPSVPESKTVTHVMMLPSEEDDERQKIKRLGAIRRACDAFGVDYSNGVNVDHFVGETAWSQLKVENSPEYGEQNRVARFLEPK